MFLYSIKLKDEILGFVKANNVCPAQLSGSRLARSLSKNDNDQLEIVAKRITNISEIPKKFLDVLVFEEEDTVKSLYNKFYI